MEEDRKVNRSWWKVLLFWLPELKLTPGSALTLLLSLALSGPAVTRGADVESKLDLEAEVLESLSALNTDGLGGCFFLDPSESLLCRIDETLPFRVLKRIPLLKYIPASLAERNASQTRKINPPPGSYPTQQYYTPPQDFQDTYSPYHHLKPAGTWPPADVSTYPIGAAPGVHHHDNHVCSGGHAHSHNDNGFSPNNFEASLKNSFGISPAQSELLQVQTQ
ncbi:rhomboid domain-containing protein 2 isoform X2 [Mixophyes fleayi]|uniref:rhomboid domain-containing protein 2 isoform X2 n=1 Tax=Mixophyes fleayi TaxID=3061075 RepID=UPI003F4DDC31